MNNKEWVEIKLTEEQFEFLADYNIITVANAMYALGLGVFYKLEKGGDKYMTTNRDLLPDYVLQCYRHIINNEYYKKDKFR